MNIRTSFAAALIAVAAPISLGAVTAHADISDDLNQVQQQQQQQIDQSKQAQDQATQTDQGIAGGFTR
ncbi:hypothetical protein [Nocardia sp. CDC160]|uniref:hypothetical protein n=1 Tax=Nocardia sp. CDC160 TaxID=3112166 RepID=UPI002DB79FC7|nr:hypothetical protein [Nocardia sp. CDC160]MEC3917173.1 hypothetical protein [Nocardia sp. CDC160]